MDFLGLQPILLEQIVAILGQARQFEGTNPLAQAALDPRQLALRHLYAAIVVDERREALEFPGRQAVSAVAPGVRRRLCAGEDLVHGTLRSREMGLRLSRPRI